MCVKNTIHCKAFIAVARASSTNHTASQHVWEGWAARVFYSSMVYSGSTWWSNCWSLNLCYWHTSPCEQEGMMKNRTLVLVSINKHSQTQAARCYSKSKWEWKFIGDIWVGLFSLVHVKWRASPAKITQPCRATRLKTYWRFLIGSDMKLSKKLMIVLVPKTWFW